jgi:hypothetical protein
MSGDRYAYDLIKMTEFARFLFENKETNFRVFTILRLYAIEIAGSQRQVLAKIAVRLHAQERGAAITGESNGRNR